MPPDAAGPLGPISALMQVAATFDALGIAYYLGGSIASSAHGLFRQTADVDFVADMTPRLVDPFVAALKDDFYVDAGSIREAISRSSSFNVIHLGTMEKCDIFIQGEDPWNREQMKTRVRRPVIAGTADEFWMDSAECIVIQKLKWNQACGGTSEQQFKDVLGVLVTGRDTLDLGYLRHWAGVVGVAPELERALRDAGLAE